MKKIEIEILKEALTEAYGTANGVTKFYVELIKETK